MNEGASLFTDATGYERFMGRWSRLVGAQFLGWLDAPAGARWLDVGCGNGAFTEEIVARGAPAAVAAVDPAAAALAFARTRPGLQTVDFRTADALALPFPAASFDVAVMALVIAFVPDPARAVAEMARVVRPGGLVASYMWDFAAGGTPVHPFAVAMKSLGMETPTRPNSEASRLDVLHDLWSRAGLESIVGRPVIIPVTFASFDDFWESNDVTIGPVGTLLAKMSTATKEQLRLRLREQLPAAADGRIVFEARANAIKGVVARASEPQAPATAHAGSGS